MSSHQSRDTKPSDRLSQGTLKIWTEHFNKSHFMKYSHGGGPGDPMLKSLTSEVIPLATQFFESSYKTSHNLGLY